MWSAEEASKYFSSLFGFVRPIPWPWRPQQWHFLPHPGHGVFHAPQRGWQKGFYTECSPSHCIKFQYLWGTLESFSPFLLPPPQSSTCRPLSSHGCSLCQTEEWQAQVRGIEGMAGYLRDHQVPGREQLHLLGLSHTRTRGRMLLGSLKLLASSSRKL